MSADPHGWPTTRRHPRSLVEAFGPHTSGFVFDPIDEPRRPRKRKPGRWARLWAAVRGWFR